MWLIVSSKGYDNSDSGQFGSGLVGTNSEIYECHTTNELTNRLIKLTNAGRTNRIYRIHKNNDSKHCDVFNLLQRLWHHKLTLSEDEFNMLNAANDAAYGN